MKNYNKLLISIFMLIFPFSINAYDGNFDDNGNCYIKYKVDGYHEIAIEISYLDVNGNRVEIKNVILPWEYEFFYSKDSNFDPVVIAISKLYEDIYGGFYGKVETYIFHSKKKSFWGKIEYKEIGTSIMSGTMKEKTQWIEADQIKIR